jgi:hemoglobin
VIGALADRFYALIDADPRYAALRAIHEADLRGVRQSLAGFMTGWLGGPRDWFDARPGRCIVSLHRGVDVTPATAGQWLHAMGRALEEAQIDPGVAGPMRRAFAGMAATIIALD